MYPFTATDQPQYKRIQIKKEALVLHWITEYLPQMFKNVKQTMIIKRGSWQIRKLMEISHHHQFCRLPQMFKNFKQTMIIKRWSWQIRKLMEISHHLQCRLPMVRIVSYDPHVLGILHACCNILLISGGTYFKNTGYQLSLICNLSFYEWLFHGIPWQRILIR